ncbi:MAG: hypothetical protein WA667_00305 [Candidatus Nitrosopolaris sp.]
MKAPEMDYGDKNGNNGEVSREKNDLNKEEKQTKLHIPPSPWKKFHLGQQHIELLKI